MKVGVVGGLFAGGTERYLQSLARGLADRGHQVTFLNQFPHSPGLGFAEAVESLTDSGIRIVSWTDAYHLPVRPNLRDSALGKAGSGLDFIIYGTDGGLPSFLKVPWSTRLVPTVHYLGGCYVPREAVSVWHVSRWSADQWFERGGRHSDIRVVSHPLDALPRVDSLSAKVALGLEDYFVFGFHQRDEDGIFSEIPLSAYAKVESEQTAFLLVGGSQKYRLQAQSLGLKKFVQLDAVSDRAVLGRYLSAVDVYCHGRKDGEVNSVAIAEAMGLGLPIISHDIGTSHLGHLEQLAKVGFVAGTEEEYSAKMTELMADYSSRKKYAELSGMAFAQRYNFAQVITEAENALEELLNIPKPNLRPFGRLAIFARALVASFRWKPVTFLLSR